MIKQNPNPLTEQKTGLMQDGGRLIVLNCLFAVLALLSASYSSFSQKIGDSPSSKTTVESLNSHNVRDGDSCELSNLPSIIFSKGSKKINRNLNMII